MSDLELRKEIPCAIKFAIVLATTAPETVKLMNEAYKDKCFSESTAFRWHGDLKKRNLSAELAQPHQLFETSIFRILLNNL